jgi:pimeloyl-ACP methyl ester carboxylesterase
MLLGDGTEIFVTYRFQDNGKPPVVFIHGDGQNHTVWKNLMGYFSGKGHSVLCYDLPGHGLSQPYKDRTYSFSKFVETLKQVLEEKAIRKPLLVGNSTGGMIALKYAAEKPCDVTCVVAVSSCDVSPAKHNPKLRGEEMIKKYIEASKKLFQGQGLFDYGNPGLSDEDIFLAAVKNTSPEAIEGNLNAVKDYDIRSELRNIRVPVLLFRGSKDLIITGKWMKRMKEEIPFSKLITLEGYGHHVLLQNPDKIEEGIIENYSFLMQE